MGDVKRISTEAGMIPKGWDIGTLGEAFSNIEAGVSVNSDERLASEFYVLKTSAVHDGIVDAKESKPVVSADYHRLKCPLQQGSIIISRMNTPELVGAVGFNCNDHKNTFLPDRLWQITADRGNEYDFHWLSYLLNLQRYRNAVRSTATGTSNSMKNVSKDRLKEIAIAKPSLEEQRAIAEVLADTDDLINGLTLLIEKKKNLFQGVLQAILSGKQRLPGYTSAWSEFPLSKFGTFVRGVSYNPSNDIFQYESDSTLQLLRANNIIGGSLDLSDVLYVGRNVVSDKQILQYGDIIIAMSSGSIVAIGKNAQYKLHDDKHCIGAFCAIFRSEVNDYLFYVFQSSMFREKLKASLEGSSINNLTGKSLGNMVFAFPTDKYEWDAISRCLNEMNDDIASLQAKLEKYKMLKSGIMDELLTGKIRLV